jgi:hypothetical protein
MMSKLFHLPTLLLSVSFLSALLAVGHGAVGTVIESPGLLFLLPIVLGATYSLLLYRMAKGGVADSVFRSSLVVVLGLTVIFLWMLSGYYFPELYPNQGSGNADFGHVIQLLLVYLAIPAIILYSIFALWYPTKLATTASRGAGGQRGAVIFFGGFWGLLLVAFCLAMSQPTYAFYTGNLEQFRNSVANVFFIEVVVCIATFIGSWFLTVRNS